jgi:hypothetical protein
MMMRNIAAALLLCTATAAYAQTETDKSLTGHYYLSGVMETGSELLLKPDGTYQWILMYGSMDAYSEGDWHTENGGDKKRYVILKANIKNAAKEPVTFGEFEPWNEYLEQAAQDDEMADRNTARIGECPFLGDPSGEGYTDAAMTPPYREVTADIKSEAENAVNAEVLAANNYGTLAAAAMNAGAKDSPLQQKARDARIAWRAARDKARQAASDAGMYKHKSTEPVLPKQCVLETWPQRPQDIEQSKWTRGIAIKIMNPLYESYINDVNVIFTLKSGKVIDRTTRGGGVAWIPRTADDRLVSITVIGNNGAGPKLYTFKVPETAEGYFPINVNNGAEDAPFTQMQLTVLGDALIGFEGRGRYTRN